MSSPSSARVPVGNSGKQVHSSKRDATGRSRAFGASVSNSSRRINGSVANVNGGASGHGSSHATRVYLDGVDVTPQSLLVSRIKPMTPSGNYDPRGKGKGGKGSRSKAYHGVVSGAGASVMNASVLFSNASSSSADNDSDNESSSSVVGTGGNMSSRGPRKDARPGAADHVPTAPSSNQEDEESSRIAPPLGGSADPEDNEDGKDDAVDPLVATSSLGVESDIALLNGAKTLPVATGATTFRARRAPVTVTLAETATEMLLELRSVCVAQDAPNHAAVTARNKRYQTACAQKKGSDKFVEGRAQTLQLASKAKEVMTAPPATRDAACVATDWDIYDCGKIDDDSNAEIDEVGVGAPVSSAESQAQMQSTATSSEGQSKDAVDGASATTSSSSGVEGVGTGNVGNVQLKQQVDEIVGATLASPGCVLDVDGDIVEDLRARQHHASKSNRKTRDKHGQSNAYSRKSRMLDSQRSTAVAAAAVSGNSNASAVGGEQSSGNVSVGASQDFMGAATGEGASSGSATSNSQVGMSIANASRGVLSGGPAGGSGDGKPNSVYARANTNVDIGEIISRQRTAQVLGSASLLLTANIVERAVQQNVYHQQHVRYRDFPTLLAPALTTEPPSVVVPALGMGFPTTIGFERSNSSSNGIKEMEQLEELWAFRCGLTQDRAVSCLAWNTANEDLLAVSYARAEPFKLTESTGPSSPAAVGGGGIGFAAATTVPGSPGPRAGQNTQTAAASTATGEENDGLVLFWSLTNPEYPERIYHLPVSVTSIDFSTAHPYLLAVGFADGVVSIYDTRKDDATSTATSGSTAVPASGVDDTSAKHVPVPIATSSGMSGKHLDAVWQVRWVARGGGESVVSVSGDGRVVEWSLKKGLSFSDLMTLKRAPNPLLGGAGAAATGTNGGAVGVGNDGVISRQASGRSLTFASRGDPSVYFVGTEDGLVHKCSVSYNEQYLQTYIGHTGPVYQLLVSPFCNNLFLSCSGDWSLKLWHQADPRGDAVLTFHSVDLAQAVLGASWSPTDAAVFAAVAEDGRIELWDLVQSTLDPIVRHFPKKYVSVAAPVPQAADSDILPTTSSRDATPKSQDDTDTFRDPNTANTTATMETMVEVPLECTTVAFAPKAPVLVVGDSTGDVTVYRVPAQVSTTCAAETDETSASVEEQAARLLRAIHPNKHD